MQEKGQSGQISNVKADAETSILATLVRGLRKIYESSEVRPVKVSVEWFLEQPNDAIALPLHRKSYAVVYLASKSERCITVVPPSDDQWRVHIAVVCPPDGYVVLKGDEPAVSMVKEHKSGPTAFFVGRGEFGWKEPKLGT